MSWLSAQWRYWFPITQVVLTGVAMLLLVLIVLPEVRVRMPVLRPSVLFDEAPAMRPIESAIVLTVQALQPLGPMHELAVRQHFKDNPWDPGFGRHEQTACRDPKVIGYTWQYLEGK